MDSYILGIAGFLKYQQFTRTFVHHASRFSAFLHWYYFEHPFSRLIFFSGLCCRQQEQPKSFIHILMWNLPPVSGLIPISKSSCELHPPKKNPKHLATPRMRVCALCPSLLRPPWIKVMSDARDPRRNNHSSSYRLDPYLAAVFSNKDGGAWRIIPVSKWLITMVSKSPNWGYSPSKWPRLLMNGAY